VRTQGGYIRIYYFIHLVRTQGSFKKCFFFIINTFDVIGLHGVSASDTRLVAATLPEGDKLIKKLSLDKYASNVEKSLRSFHAFLIIAIAAEILIIVPEYYEVIKERAVTAYNVVKSLGAKIYDILSAASIGSRISLLGAAGSSYIQKSAFSAHVHDF
jgi:hypothetical protein